MQVCYLLGCKSFQFQQLAFTIRVYELVDSHKAAAHTHDEFVVHDFGKYLFGSKHVEAFTQSGDRKLHPS